MLRRLISKLVKCDKKHLEDKKEDKNHGFFSNPDYTGLASSQTTIDKAMDLTLQRDPIVKPVDDDTGATMDAAVNAGQPFSLKIQSQGGSALPSGQLEWYASQGFIGYNACAILSQHWLISRACELPAADCIRNWFEITVNDGEDVKPEVLDEMREQDDKFKLQSSVKELIEKGRLFGIRVAYFKVNHDKGDEYYKLPFNLDSVKPGSYKGIVQIDPFWIIGQLDFEASGDPSSKHFYEPTWWQVGTLRIHRSHCIVYRTTEMPDVIKPTYLWGGIPVPQMMATRTYAAERLADEAPMLALTKRTDIYKVDSSAAVAKGVNFFKRIQDWVYNRDNYGIKIIDKEAEDVAQFDTSLDGLKDNIMTQYQLSSSIAGIPAVKLLGVSPTGLNSTGEGEEAVYHEMIGGLQAGKVTDMVKRHHELVIKSIIIPKYGIKEFDCCIEWRPLDEQTAKEKAETNQFKAQTDVLLEQTGAIDASDVRNRVITDKESGYNGIDPAVPEGDDLGFEDLAEEDTEATELPNPAEYHGTKIR